MPITRVKKIEMPRQVRTLELLPASINVEERTVDTVWTTGARVDRFDWWSGETYVEVLEVSDAAINMERLNNGAPVLDSHDAGGTDTVVGTVERAWLEKGRGMATLRFAKNDERADKIWNKISQGILRSLSVGYSVEKYAITEENGVRTFTATNWTPLEISVVAIPADAAAGIRNTPDKFSCQMEYHFKHNYKRQSRRSKEPGRMSRQKKQRDKNFKRQLEGAGPASVEAVVAVVDDEVSQIDAAVESALEQLEAAAEAAPAEVTQIIAELAETVDNIVSEADAQIEAALGGDSGEGDGKGGEGRKTDDENEETRAGRIVGICALAEMSAREALDFIERGMSVKGVRGVVLKRQAQAFKDNPTRSIHAGGVKNRDESLSGVAKEQFNK